MFKDDLPTEEVRILLRLIRKAGREKDFVAFNERKLADLDSRKPFFGGQPVFSSIFRCFGVQKALETG